MNGNNVSNTFHVLIKSKIYEELFHVVGYSHVLYLMGNKCRYLSLSISLVTIILKHNTLNHILVYEKRNEN